MSQTIIDIPLRTILRIIAVIAAVGFLFVIRDILLLFLFAIVLASGIAPIISWFERRGVPRLLGLIFIILVAFASLVILLYAVIPPLLREFQDFAKNFPTYARMVLLGLRPIGIEPASPIGQGVSQGLQQLAQLLGRGVSLLPAVTIQLFGGIFTTASLLLVTFYLSLDRDGVEKLIRLFVPVDEESYILDLWRRSQRKIGSWARGQILLMLLVGVLTYVGLSLLKVHYTLLLSIVAGIFELVPVVGPVMAGAAAVAVAIFQSPALALFVLVFAVLLQQIENHFIVPLLYRRILGLNPVIVIFALLIGGKLGGIVGIVLAVPIVAVVMEFLGDYTKGKVRL
jgi:predicted PurR-regulated permease PerM